MKFYNNWDHLTYWSTGEWQVVEEKLNDCKRSGISVNPDSHCRFAALKRLKPEDVRVAIIGQDPYPNKEFATGIAFEIPSNVVRERYPATLLNIFKEYQDDLHYPFPSSGDLSVWVSRGILLWNAYPTCITGRPGSHHWIEWESLTAEIIRTLGDGRVFIFLGNSARKFV